MGERGGERPMLTRWNPWQDLFDFQWEMSDILRQGVAVAPTSVWRSWTPAVDVFTRGGDLVVRAELPGIDPEKDIDISVQDGYLMLRGERKHEAKTNGDNYYRIETSRGSFQRYVPLPEGVKPDSIKATYEDCILDVVVAKAGELPAPKPV